MHETHSHEGEVVGAGTQRLGVSAMSVTACYLSYYVCTEVAAWFFSFAGQNGEWRKLFLQLYVVALGAHIVAFDATRRAVIGSALLLASFGVACVALSGGLALVLGLTMLVNLVKGALAWRAEATGEDWARSRRVAELGTAILILVEIVVVLGAVYAERAVHRGFAP